MLRAAKSQLFQVCCHRISILNEHFRFLLFKIPSSWRSWKRGAYSFIKFGESYKKFKIERWFHIFLKNLFPVVDVQKKSRCIFFFNLSVFWNILEKTACVSVCHQTFDYLIWCTQFTRLLEISPLTYACHYSYIILLLRIITKFWNVSCLYLSFYWLFSLLT